MPLPIPQTFRHHITREDWLKTPNSDPRGYIQPSSLKELWFHTGTICNLSCPFCLEGSRPGDDRINKLTYDDAKPFINEALELGVEKFSFTGGEPFVIKDMVRILDYALEFRPCLVLTNATNPLIMRLLDIVPLKDKKNRLNFRVSLDHPDPQKHDRARGEGNFQLALKTLGELYRQGFGVSIARQRAPNENTSEVDRLYHRFFHQVNVPPGIRIVSFPEFLTPGSTTPGPHITENCMTTYQTEETRSHFMCHFSKMVLKKEGKMRVYACTLVDDDPDYDLGASLKESMPVRVMLKHHRCYSCFSGGVSCSEL